MHLDTFHSLQLALEKISLHGDVQFDQEWLSVGEPLFVLLRF